MIAFWGLMLGVPLLAFGGAAFFSSAKASCFVEWFKTSRPVALVLTIVGWYWTAYECNTIGIDVFDMLLKRFPGQLWIMAAVLSYLTFIWMPAHLPVRALTAILMLIPAELFKTTRLLVPASGFAAVHVFVVTAYVGAIIGMYGMFYPWRLEKAMAWFQGSPKSNVQGPKSNAPSTLDFRPETLDKGFARLRALGAVLAVWGAALICIGFSI